MAAAPGLAIVVVAGEALVIGTGVGAMMNMTTSFTLSEADGGTSMAWAS